MHEPMNEQMDGEKQSDSLVVSRKTNREMITFKFNLESQYTGHEIVTSEPAVYNFCCLSSQIESPLGCGHLVQMISVSIAYNIQHLHVALVSTWVRELTVSHSNYSALAEYFESLQKMKYIVCDVNDIAN